MIRRQQTLIFEPLLQAATVIARSWDQFWFRPSDPYPLAVIRLLAGGMLLYSHLVWGVDLKAFFAESGWNHADIIRSLQNDSFSFSFWWYVPEAWMLPVHVVCCIVVAMFTLGWQTRVTSIASWIIAVSYAQRSMLANYGLDQILCALVLYLTLAPTGSYLSVDAWLRKRRHDGDTLPTVPPSVMACVSARLIQLHLCVMYFFAGLSKLQGNSWWNGNAVWQTLSNYEYQSFDLTFLAAFPIITQLATHATVIWEASFSALVWNRTLRPLVLMIGTSMHVGIGMFLGMWTFGLAMTFGYVTFIPTARLRALIHGKLRIPAAAVPFPEPVLASTQLPSGELIRPAEASQETISESHVRESNFDTVEANPAPKSPSPASIPLKEGEGIHAASELLINTSDDPMQTNTEVSGLILVTKSTAMATKAIRYFRRYGQRTSLVDGMIQARELCRLGQGSVVVALDAHFNPEEVTHWTSMIREAAPGSRVVFRAAHIDQYPQTDHSQVIDHQSNFRDIRHVIETMTGTQMQRIETVDTEAPPRQPK